MSNYSKHKDRLPQDTIYEIQRILHEAGIRTTLRWIPSAYSGLASNRLTINGTPIGTNGKGTDKLYATASAYAEFMERMQNDMLFVRPPWPEKDDVTAFLSQPDERAISIDELIAQKDPVLTMVSRKLGIDSQFVLKTLLSGIAASFEQRNDGKMLCLPFASLTEDRVVWLPIGLVKTIYVSNGMSAGNTIAEALVQGISELFERHVNNELLKGAYAPPEIPDDALRTFSIWDTIEQIRREDNYALTVMDCSLGKGLPVAGIRIANLQKGTFCLKLGSHPSLAVAVERTLTEIFQGWDQLEPITSLCAIGSPEEVAGHHNATNVIKMGVGYYPAKLLTGEPGWTFEPWSQWEGLDNRGFLARMLALLKRENVPVLVRDASHMGFPACWVILPGWSEVYPVNRLQLRAINTACKSIAHVRRFPDLTPEEEHRLLNTIRFRERSLLENTIDSIATLSLSGTRMSANRIGAYLALKEGNFAEAYRLFQKLTDATEDPEERTYQLCMTELARYRLAGLSQDETYAVLRKLFRPEVVDRVVWETCDDATMLHKAFPRLRCFDCKNCELAGNDCREPQVREAYNSMRAAMAHSKVSQEDLLSNLLALTGN